MSQHESNGRRRRSPRVSSSSSKSNESLSSAKNTGSNYDKTPNREGGSGRKNNSNKKGIYRTSSHDHVRKLVEQEGRAARNLITWSVPVSSSQSEEKPKRTKSRVMQSRKRHSTPEKSGSSERDGSPVNKNGSKSPSRGRSGRKTSLSSSGRKSDLRARYWSYLFDNLKRAVDEIYSTCETDESPVECQEVIMMLDQCRRDFAALIERIQLQDAFEKADHKDRPTSLAWEVRKSSPGKSLVPSPCTVQDRNIDSPIRSLDFTVNSTATAVAPKPTAPNTASMNGGLSWADKVKGTPSPVASACKIVPSNTTAFTQNRMAASKLGKEERTEPNGTLEGSDDEGWETVRHGKKNHDHGSNKKDSAKGRSNNVPTNITSNLQNKSSSHNGNTTSVLQNDKIPVESSSKTIVKPINGVADTSKRKGSLTSDEEEELAVPIDYILSDNDEQESDYDEEHQKAISEALEEEETLSREIEEWQEQALASAIEHEESLNEEIKREEAFVTALNGQGETPTSEMETETEGEGGEQENGGEAGLDDSSKNITWDEMVAKYDADHESGDAMSWGDAVEQAESRPPGRAVAMHQKLSSPSRKRSLAEKIRIHEEKQIKAHEQRERLLEERLRKLQVLSVKVEKVRDLQEDLMHQRHCHLAEKHQRAQQQRMVVLQEKVRKAQEEEAKVNEIAFINTLEAQNKKIEVMSRFQGHEARLQDLQEERQRKREEQQAKETAAQERRRQLEAERMARLEEMQQRKLEQEAKYKREKMERERAREEAAKEKAREREMRIAARNEALQTAVEQLQLKIQQKQTESTRRHEQVLEQVKEKAAAGVSRHPTQEEVPTVTPYDTKKICTLCNVEIVSEVYLLSHLRGKKHQQALLDTGIKPLPEEKDTVSLQYIKDMPSENNEEKKRLDLERMKAQKKRAKKLRTRMAAKGREYEGTLSSSGPQKQDSSKKPRLQKIIKELNRHLQAQATGPWTTTRVSALERSVGELTRILEAKEKADQLTFTSLDGLSVLTKVLQVVDVTETKPATHPIIPCKAMCHVVNAMTLACAGCIETSQYIVLANKLPVAVDLLVFQLRNLSYQSVQAQGKKTPDKESKDSPSIPNPTGDPLVAALLRLVSTVLQSLAPDGKEVKETSAAAQRNLDLVSYIVCSDLIDDIKNYLSCIREPFEDDALVIDMVLNSIGLLSSIGLYLGSRSNGVFETKKEDMTQYVQVFKETELVAIISTLYTMLLHSGHQRQHSPPPTLPQYQVTIATEGLRALNNMAAVDLRTLQGCLGSEGISLQFRHIVSYLLWICGEGTSDVLLHEVILIVGHFTVLNQENQVFVQSGRNPTLLQQLCSLPFQYFSDPRLRNILFPSLIAACYDNEENKTIIEQEVSCALLENFLQDKLLDCHQEQLLKSKNKPSDDDVPKRFTLAARFPGSLWKEAGVFLVGAES